MPGLGLVYVYLDERGRIAIDKRSKETAMCHLTVNKQMIFEGQTETVWLSCCFWQGNGPWTRC